METETKPYSSSPGGVLAFQRLNVREQVSRAPAWLVGRTSSSALTSFRCLVSDASRTVSWEK